MYLPYWSHDQRQRTGIAREEKTAVRKNWLPVHLDVKVSRTQYPQMRMVSVHNIRVHAKSPEQPPVAFIEPVNSEYVQLILVYKSWCNLLRIGPRHQIKLAWPNDLRLPQQISQQLGLKTAIRLRAYSCLLQFDGQYYHQLIPYE